MGNLGLSNKDQDEAFVILRGVYSTARRERIAPTLLHFMKKHSPEVQDLMKKILSDMIGKNTFEKYWASITA